MTVLPLPEMFDQKAASEFSDNLIACRGGEISIDASAVSKLSAISIELLISAVNQWQEDGFGFTIINCSSAFLSTLEALGVAPIALKIEHRS